MIREFQLTDPRRIKGNTFSSTRGLMKDFFLNPVFYKQTLVSAGGDVYAIIVFGAYNIRNYIAMFFISEDMPLMAARELRKFLHGAIMDFNADRIQTDSPDCEMLNKWHKFLGFTLEGRREKMANNMDYNLWGMLKGRDF